jgi:hypothetical protein
MVPPYAAVMAAPFFVLWVVWVRRLCAREQSSRARDEESHTIQHIYVVGIHRRDPVCRENGTFLEFSLCLSRACLGKMIVFIYKWLKNAVFRSAYGKGRKDNRLIAAASGVYSMWDAVNAHLG